MSKKLFFSFGALCLMALLVLFTGCEDKDLYNPEPPIEGEGPSTLDYSTSKTLTLNLNYQVSPGYVSTFDVYTEYPLDGDGVLKQDLQPIAGGINIAGVSEIKRVIPAYAKELYVYSEDLFIPRLLHATIDNAAGVAMFMPATINVANEEVAQTRTIGNKKVDKYLKAKSDFYDDNKKEFDWGSWRYKLLESKYDLKVPDMEKEIPSELLNAIAQSFPEKTAVAAKYYEDAMVEVKSDPNDVGGARIHVSVLHAGCGHNNALSYFVYSGEKNLEDLTLEERNELEVINVFQFADVYNNSFKSKEMGLTPGHYVQLKYKNEEGQYVNEFPIGSKIGWILHSNGFDEKNFKVNEDATNIYSIASWNPNNAKRTIFFGYETKGGDKYSCFGFEDTPEGGDNDCNDVIFHVHIDPFDAVNPPPFIPEPGTIEKTSTHCGVLAFEDNWPNKGDYDLNDVVVKYNSTITYVQDGETTENSGGELVGKGEVTVKKVEDVFSFVHTGATFANGFSYKVDIDPSKIKSIRITDNKGKTVDYNAIADGAGFIVNICDDVKKLISPMVPVTTPAVFTVRMDFNEKAVKGKEFVALQAPYNPYIRPANTNIDSDGIEVHLPFYHPTTMADMSLFGTRFDVSDPATGTYYASKENSYYPFALHIFGTSYFTIPTESKPIDYTYPRYKNWREKKCGSEDADWYLHPIN
ncbi:LruC domain-containing protein [Bacteroides sp. 214]|uniref:LruC domain-containing protein n=1 Tax=Bacteroides sp. 214 TaxID=2302935 RepID=UPI0013D7E19B|nr:LruC domain-containing protein [Bacteroides sp. 214]NDW12585.1 LruC domain-containing protein [Bacteroides sp. 214]